jgi:hypothetical protein
MLQLEGITVTNRELFWEAPPTNPPCLFAVQGFGSENSGLWK